MGGIAPYEAQIPHLARSSRGSNWRCFTIFFHVCASSSRYRSPQSTLYVMLRCTMGGYPPPPQMIWKKAEKYKGPLNAIGSEARRVGKGCFVGFDLGGSRICKKKKSE